MNIRSVYYHLHTNTMNPCSISKKAATIGNMEWLCADCNYPKPEITSIDVIVQQPGPIDEPLNFIYGFGLVLAKRLFVDVFGENVISHNLYLGRLSLEGGRQIDDWITVRSRHGLIIRGTKNVSWRRCLKCNRNVYFAMGSRYLFPAPPSGYEIFESDLSGLVISKRLLSLIDLSKWPKLVIDELPVLATPKDALPEVVSFY